MYNIPVDIIRVFYVPEFVAKNLKVNKNHRKDHSFYNAVSLKNFTHFTNLNSFKIENNMLPKYNFLSLHIFQQTCFCLVSEKTFALHHFLTPKNYFLEAL